MKKIMIFIIIVITFVFIVKGFYFFKAESIKDLNGSILFSGSLTKFGKTVPAIGVYNFATKKSLIFEEEGVVFDLQIMPNGEDIVYRINKEKDVYLKNLKTGKTEKLFGSSSNKVQYSVPSWSRRGDKMVYLKGVDGNKAEIFIKNLANGLEEKVTEATYRPKAVMISPDGEKVSFIGFDPEEARDKIANPRLYFKNLNSGEIINIKGIDQIQSYEWSSDGEKICYASLRDRQIHLVDLNTLDDRVVTKTKNMIWHCSFSPDGSKVIFDAVPSFGATTPGEIYIINTDGSKLRRIYPNGNWNSVYSPSWFEV